MRRPLAALVTVSALVIGTVPIAALPAHAVELAPRAATSGTPEALLRTLPAAAPLRVGYKRGSFPVQNPLKKDKRGCTLRNQLLIKAAKKRPTVGKGCKLTGGAWAVDFGTRIETNPAKIRLMRLLPDVYVYGQGGYMWSTAQRAAYSSYVAPSKQTRIGYRVGEAIVTQSSVTPITANYAIFMARMAVKMTQTSTPSQQDLEALRALNPKAFEGWTLATLLNAKAWGISLSPTVYANFQATIEACSADPSKANPCTQTYTVTTPNAADPSKPGTTTTYEIPTLPVVETSVIAPTIPAIVTGYTQPPHGDVTSRDLFGIHAPAQWFYDEESEVDGPVDPATIPSVPVGYVRMWDTETTWKDLEPAKGTFIWRKLAKQIQVAQDRNAKVMLVLGMTPAWASSNGGPTGAPKDIADWRSYVHEVACHFGPSIHAYEIWNEANLTTFWGGTPAQLADLTKAAFEEIKGCNPGALVVAANTTSRAEGSFGNFFPAYLQELKARGWPANAYSVHSYPKAAGGNGDRIAGISQFRTMLALAGALFTTVFDTEVNYGMEGLGQGKVAITGEPAAALMSRTYIDSVRYGFGSTFWFVWTAQPDPKMGIQFTPDASAEKQAWNKTYEWLVGAQFHACGEVPLYVGLVVCQFDRGGSPFSLAWFGEVNDGSSAKVARGVFNGLGSQCERLLGGSCNGILDGTEPITSTPVKISGPALPTIDMPVSIVLRPQPVPTIATGQSTPLTITATTSDDKSLANEKLTIRLEGPVSLDGDQGPVDITTGANGQFTINIKGESDGVGKLTITSVRNPSLVFTADLTVAPQQVVVLDSIISRGGRYATQGVITGFPRGFIGNTKQRWQFVMAFPKSNRLPEPMLPGANGAVQSAFFDAPAGTLVQIEAQLIDMDSRKVVAKVVSNKLKVPEKGETATR